MRARRRLCGFLNLVPNRSEALWDVRCVCWRGWAQHRDFAFKPIETTLRKSVTYAEEYKRIRDRYEPRLQSTDYTVERQREDVAEAKAQINNGILHLYFTYLDNTHPILRLLAAIFFAIGFAALAVPSVQVFLRVTYLLISII